IGKRVPKLHDGATCTGPCSGTSVIDLGIASGGVVLEDVTVNREQVAAGYHDHWLLVGYVEFAGSGRDPCQRCRIEQSLILAAAIRLYISAIGEHTSPRVADAAPAGG